MDNLKIFGISILMCIVMMLVKSVLDLSSGDFAIGMVSYVWAYTLFNSKH